MSRVTLLAALTVLATGAAIAGADPAALGDGHGIHVAAMRQLDARQLDVQVSTAALQHPVDVRILLPDRYGDDPQRRYPVLYLFHGTSGRPSDWINFGNAEQTTAGLPLIVVLPDAGFDGDGGGWFTNWYNGGAGGQPMWETFHIDQIVPWIDANLRTISRREGRAIAGLSQGGFGSLSYAARHPDLFTSVAAFSGGCEIDRDPEAMSIATGIIQYTASALDGVDPDAMFGPRATAELNWQAHDPATLVTNLRGMQIELWTGDGDRGPLDQGPPDPAASAIEVITFGATRLFHGHLEDARIPSGYHYYGAGTHTFGYWARDLEEYVGPMMRRFASSRGRPTPVDFLSAADRWQQWGWTVSVAPVTPGFNRLRHARKGGFTLTGTGRATVRTPSVYPSGVRARVTVIGKTGRSSTDLTASPSGALRIPVPLSHDATPGTTRVAIRLRPHLGER
jgi:S-formylglutathione hydrolase FrmB